jgi:hypothetical protein
MVDFDKLAREHYERATLEERQRIDAARERERVEAARPRIRVAAERTNLSTGVVRQVEVTLVVRPSVALNHELFVHVEGGPTGHESASYERLFEEDGRDWCACTGTEGRWDRLVLSAASLRQAREFFEPRRRAGELDG